MWAPIRGRSARTALCLLAAMLATLTAATPAAAWRSDSDWPMWQHDSSGSRYNGAEQRITPRTVGRLTPRWVFAFPDAGGMQSSQPAVVDGRVYVGGHNGVMYALDEHTGRTIWSYDSHGGALRDGPSVTDGTVYFGDSHGTLHALDQRTGRLRWTKQVDPHPAAIITSSPLLWHGVLIVGVSSKEYLFAADNTYPCCSFRGSVVALDAHSGRQLWRHFTMPIPAQTGTTSDGVPVWGPSGAAVWSSPAVDPATGTVFVGTGNNYSGTTGDSDSVFALDAWTGRVRWSAQMTHPDTWNLQCFKPQPNERCPQPGPNHDFGASPTVYKIGWRTVVAFGQKSGVYHVFDAHTGAVVWQTTLNPVGTRGSAGVQWGASYDGKRIYAATYHAQPGALHALDPATGAVLWRTPLPADACTTGGAATMPDPCDLAMTPAPTSIPGLVFEGGEDGRIRAYASQTGAVVWDYDTVRSFQAVNGVPAHGGSISGAGGAVVADGMLFVNSGYVFGTGIPGNVLIAFSTRR